MASKSTASEEHQSVATIYTMARKCEQAEQARKTDLVNLKVCAIKWEASPHCCSTRYLVQVNTNFGIEAAFGVNATKALDMSHSWSSMFFCM